MPQLVPNSTVHGTEKSSLYAVCVESQTMSFHGNVVSELVSLFATSREDGGAAQDLICCCVGEPVKFAPGELQVEEAKQEAAETRLPTLPMLPAIESSCKGSGLECEQLEHDQRETWEALGTSAYEERKCSTLETSAGFYLKCKNFLPVATPEQHFRVFGLSRPLSKEEWEDFKNDAQASGDAG